jgi:hypothetical protein
VIIKVAGRSFANMLGTSPTKFFLEITNAYTIVATVEYSSEIVNVKIKGLFVEHHVLLFR